MARFHLPFITDFSTRVHTTSSVLAKATYIQNGFIKQDTTPKLYNRPAIIESTGQGSAIQWIAGCQYYDGTLALVGYDTGTTKTNFYTAANAAATPTLVYTLLTGKTYNTCDIIPIKNTDGIDKKNYFITFNSVSAGGISAFEIVPGTGATSITDADYPTNTTYKGIAYLDDYVFVLAYDSVSFAPRIYNSDLDDCTSWNALGYIVPELREGKPAGIDTYKNHVAFFGSKNIQFFYDAAGASPGSPLLPRQDLVYNFGLLVNSGIPNAKAWWKSKVGDILSFIGVTHDGKKFIGLFNDFQVEQISNTFINGLLDEYSDITICGYSYYGKTFIHICINGAISLYYDLETKLWHTLSSTISHFSSQPRLMEFIDNRSAKQPTFISYCQGTDDSAKAYAGRLYYFDQPENAHTDVESDGTTTHTVDLVVQTARYRGESGIESQRKFLDELQIIGDTLTSADTISLTYSDDDYQTFSSARTIDLTASLKQLQRLGYFRERAFKWTYSGTQQVRLEAMEGQLRVGTN